MAGLLALGGCAGMATDSNGGGPKADDGRQALVERVQALSRAVDEQGQRQEELVRALEERRSGEEGQDAPRKGLKKEVGRLKSRIKRLEGTTEVNSHEVERLGEKQAEVLGKLEDKVNDLSQRVARLAQAQQKAGGAPEANKSKSTEKGPSDRTGNEAAGDEGGANGGATGSTAESAGEQEPADKEAYKAAYARLREGAYAEAAEAFRAFLADFPDSRYAANALYWLGESQYVQGQYAQALQTFRRVQKDYTDSGKAAAALLKEGYAYYELEDYRKARKTLLEVVDQYPEDRVADLARKRLERIRQEQL